MRALEIELNGNRLVVAGSKTATLISADINLSVHESGGTLHVRGMEDAGNDVHSHLSWEMFDLGRMDRLTVKLVEVETATSPCEERRTDSPEYVADQAAYEDQLRTNPLVPRVLEPKQPAASVALHWKDQPPIVAVFESGREFIACRFNWDSFRPDRCRVTLTSFSQVEALSRTGGRDWFKGMLNVGHSCAIELDV